MQHPDWAQHLPDHIRLNSSQIERLEIIRAAVGEPHDDFYLHIVSPLNAARCSNVGSTSAIGLSNRDKRRNTTLRASSGSRYATAQLTGHDLFGLRTALPDAESLNDPYRALGAVADVVRAHGWTDIEHVAQAIADEESSLPQIEAAPGTIEVVRQVRLILQERTG
jgi:hypothetical protein